MIFSQREAWAAAASRAAAESFFDFYCFFCVFQFENGTHTCKFQFSENYPIWSFFWLNAPWVVRAFSFINFRFYLIKISAETIQKYKRQDFANKLLFLYEIIEKQLPSIYWCQASISTRRAALAKGRRRVLRTINYLNLLMYVRT